MLQRLLVDQPIPSCQIYDIHINENNKLSFGYMINTPHKIPVSGNQYNFVVYKNLANLIVRYVSDMKSDSINIVFHNLTEYKKLLRTLRLMDLQYRRLWLANNPDASPNIIVLPRYPYYDNISLKRAGINYIAKARLKTKLLLWGPKGTKQYKSIVT